MNIRNLHIILKFYISKNYFHILNGSYIINDIDYI